jgi:hypothetical protein
MYVQYGIQTPIHFDVTKNNILNRKAGPSGSESIDMPAAFG